MNLKPTMEGHRIGLSCGDIEFAMVNAVVYSINSFHAGVPLDTIEADVKHLQELWVMFRQPIHKHVIILLLQQVLNLRQHYQSNDHDQQPPWILTGSVCNEATMMKEAQESNNVMSLFNFYFRKMWMAYVFNNYTIAYEMAVKGRDITTPAAFSVFSHIFFEGMTCAAITMERRIGNPIVDSRGKKDTATRRMKRKKYLRRAKQCLKIMRKTANHCKLNCLNKVLLLEAELIVSKGGNNTLDQALALYEQSASLSKQEGFMHERALSYERAGMAVMYYYAYHQGHVDRIRTREADKAKADAYINKSISLYRLWGATAKVEQMTQKYHGHISLFSCRIETNPRYQ